MLGHALHGSLLCPVALRGHDRVAPLRRLATVAQTPHGDWAESGQREQLLLEIRSAGGITPVEALGTSLTVDEAEEILTRFADRGHLVQIRDGALAYALPGRRATPGPRTV